MCTAVAAYWPPMCVNMNGGKSKNTATFAHHCIILKILLHLHMIASFSNAGTFAHHCIIPKILLNLHTILHHSQNTATFAHHCIIPKILTFADQRITLLKHWYDSKNIARIVNAVPCLTSEGLL